MVTPVEAYPPPITAESMVVTAEPAEMEVAFGNAKVKFLILVVPVAAPMVTVVAALPMFKVVAVVLKRLAVVLAAIRSEVAAPFTVIPFWAVTAPVSVDAPSIVRVPAAETFPALVRLIPVEA